MSVELIDAALFAMSSGPLDFFELNITCSANTECYTHGLNLECRRTGYCGCMWSSSMGPAPVCNELTPASSTLGSCGAPSHSGG